MRERAAFKAAHDDHSGGPKGSEMESTYAAYERTLNPNPSPSPSPNLNLNLNLNLNPNPNPSPNPSANPYQVRAE